MSAFEQIVRDSLGRIESKVDDLSTAHAELKEKVAVADARHGFYGALSGTITAALTWFLAPHK